MRYKKLDEIESIANRYVPNLIMRYKKNCSFAGHDATYVPNLIMRYKSYDCYDIIDDI